MSTPESKGSAWPSLLAQDLDTVIGALEEDGRPTLARGLQKAIPFVLKAEAMAAMLRELGEKSDYCAICDRWLDDGPGRGHAKDCRLALLLKDLP